jgi:hypothetical protein
MKNVTKKGQGFIEYLIIVFFLSSIVISAMKFSGVNLGYVYDQVVQALGGGPVTYFKDDFNNLSGWNAIFGPNNWKIVDGKLTTTSSGDQWIMETTSLPADYVINTTAKLVSGGGYGVMFRLTPEGNSYGGYSFQLDSGIGNKFVLRKYVSNGAEVSTPIATANLPTGFDINTSHQVSISVIGSTYTAYVDGVKVMTATDSTYSSGGAGLRTWWTSQVQVDSFSVTAP